MSTELTGLAADAGPLIVGLGTAFIAWSVGRRVLDVDRPAGGLSHDEWEERWALRHAMAKEGAALTEPDRLALTKAGRCSCSTPPTPEPVVTLDGETVGHLCPRCSGVPRG